MPNRVPTRAPTRNRRTAATMAMRNFARTTSRPPML
jgi:hypothetical protein